MGWLIPPPPPAAAAAAIRRRLRVAAESLGLAWPFVLHPIGGTDGNGGASLTIPVPSGWQQPLDLFAQAFSARLTIDPPGPPSLSVCASGLESFHLGN